MKFIRNIFICAGMVAALSLTSCENGLSTTSPSILNEEQVYSDPTLAEMGVLSIYQSIVVQYSHRDRYLPWYGFNTDIECYNSTTYRESNSGIAQYSFTATNQQMDNVNGNCYNNMVMGIERANLAIRGLETYADMTDPTMSYLHAEAVVARAFLYTEMLKAYGEVPARFEPINEDNMYINKSDRDVIYKQLISDLESVFDALPWPGHTTATSSVDRVSKAFAKGLYARLCLMASGYAQRPDPGQVGTGNPGDNRLTEDSDLQKSVLYPKALEALKDVIDHSGLELYSSYEQLWRDFNNFDLEAGKEVIFVIPFGNGRGRWNYTFAVPATAGTAGNNTSNNRGGNVGVVPSLYYKYAEGDVRRDISCVNYEWQKDINGNDVQVPAGMTHWYFGKYRYDWMEAHPFSNDMDDGAKPIYMRYADILLMAAEIAADPETSAYSLSDAQEWFMKVRTRAFGCNEAAAAAGLNLSNPTDFFDAIVDERAFEFVGEFLRKNDLIRWGMLYEKLNEAKADITALGARALGESGTDMGPGLWYRYPNGDGVVEMYGNHPGELITQDAAPLGSGWICYTDSAGETANYFGESAFAERAASMYYDGTQGQSPVIVDEDTFNQHMYWPIPQGTINDQNGKLVNDYCY